MLHPVLIAAAYHVSAVQLLPPIALACASRAVPCGRSGDLEIIPGRQI